MIDIETIDLPSLQQSVERSELYAILDACDAPSVPILCEGLGPDRSVSLYRGEAEEEYADIAPYLIRIDSAELLQWVVSFSQSDEGWGIFVVAPRPLEAMRTHFRKFLKVLDPEGKRLYFRFYDPRVLTMFLPTCDEAQLEEFFGPVRAYASLATESTASMYRRRGVHGLAKR